MKKQYTLLLLVSTVAYGWLMFITPTSTTTLNQYNLTAFQLHLLTLTLVIPIALIWALAFYGFSKFKDYAETIANRQDGKHLRTVAQGLGVLAVGLIVTTILSAALQNVALRNLDWVPKITIINNHVNLVVAIVAYYLIFRGSKGLAGLVKVKSLVPFKKLWFWLYVAAGVVYTYFALTDPIKNLAATTTSQGTFYLPNLLIIATLIIPYLVVWYIGLQGAALLAFYQQNTRGIIYKKAVSKLGLGVRIIIAVSIFLQLVTLLADRYNEQLQSSSLSFVLLVIYLLLAIIAAGFVVIAQGAKKLKMIEEVV